MKKKYWDKQQEDGIVEYIKSDSTYKRNKIYTEVLDKPLREMIKNIFYTYNFQKTIGDFSNIETELLVFVFERICKFNPELGNKAYSFFGTVIKNWLIQKSNKTKNNVSLDEEDKEIRIKNISFDIHKDDEEKKDMINFIKFINFELENIDTEKELINKDDEQVIDIIKILLKNYENMNIYNRKQVFFYIREGTSLPSRKISQSIKKIQKIYNNSKNDFFL